MLTAVIQSADIDIFTIVYRLLHMLLTDRNNRRPELIAEFVPQSALHPQQHSVGVSI